MVYHNIEHSEGIADAGNKMLLINILAAAKRYPAYYSTITAYSGKQRFSAETSVKTPFGPDFINQIYEATTKLMGNNGLSTVSLANIGQEKGVKILHSQLNRDDYRRLLIQGWPLSLVHTVLIQQVAIDEEFLSTLISHAKTACDPREHGRAKLDVFKKHACAAKQAIEKRCGNIPFRHVFHNRGDDECEFLHFQAVGTLTFIADGGLNLRVGKPEDNAMSVTFPKGKVQKKFEERKKRLANQKRSPYEMYLRSPAMIINYVGEIVAAQLFLDKSFVPSIDIHEPNGSVRSMAIFLLKRGVPDGASSKFSVSYEGDTYSIPRREYGPRASHGSYEILSYIKLLVDQATAVSELAKPPTAVLLQ